MCRLCVLYVFFLFNDKLFFFVFSVFTGVRTTYATLHNPQHPPASGSDPPCPSTPTTPILTLPDKSQPTLQKCTQTMSNTLSGLLYFIWGSDDMLTCCLGLKIFLFFFIRLS